MTMPHDEPSLDDVLEPEERAVPDHREHGKASPRPDDDELEVRTEFERREIGLTDEEETQDDA
jgi:hypothetical protein